MGKLLKTRTFFGVEREIYKQVKKLIHKLTKNVSIFK